MARETVIYKGVADRGEHGRRQRKTLIYVTIEPVGSDFVQVRARIGLRAAKRPLGEILSEKTAPAGTHALGVEIVTVSNDWRVGWA